METPKYQLINTYFVNKIQSGELAPGDELPSENELIADFNVSRITVRHALDQLYRDGYITKSRGRRASVKKLARTQVLTTISSYTEEIIRQGMTPIRKILVSELRLPTSHEAQVLQIDKSEAVFYLERIIQADKSPFCYTRTTLPYKYFRDIEQRNFSNESLYAVIENEYHIPIKTAHLNIKAILPTKAIANHLNVSMSAPLLETSAVTFGLVNNQEIPIELFSSFYLTDCFEYELVQKR